MPLSLGSGVRSAKGYISNETEHTERRNSSARKHLEMISKSKERNFTKFQTNPELSL
jgi:hypothetical protein